MLRAVATGPTHTLALTADGRVHAWGAAWLGQLGNTHQVGGWRSCRVFATVMPASTMIIWAMLALNLLEMLLPCLQWPVSRRSGCTWDVHAASKSGSVCWMTLCVASTACYCSVDRKRSGPLNEKARLCTAVVPAYRFVQRAQSGVLVTNQHTQIPAADVWTHCRWPTGAACCPTMQGTLLRPRALHLVHLSLQSMHRR